jgi:hypothetical protein
MQNLLRIFLAICSFATVSNAMGSIFSIQPLSTNMQVEMQVLKTWQAGCPVLPTRLKLVNFSYYDFNNQEHNDGKIVVLDAAANNVMAIFKELHQIKFPLAKAHVIEQYNGDDQASMLDNNTSAFNCRAITGGSLPSIHAYGLAIDINPIQNPYVSFDNVSGCTTQVLPPPAKDYLNRTHLRAGMAEQVVEIFKRNGFTVWGGKWNKPIDWQHFQVSRSLAQLLAVMTPQDATDFFAIYAAKQLTVFDEVKATDNRFIESYTQDPQNFMRTYQ